MAKGEYISLQGISKSFGTKILFDDVSIVFHENHRYGLTGPNGAGKSTLLKIITGEETPSRGSVKLPQRVGILKQNIDEFATKTVRDVVIMGNERLWSAMEERDKLYEQDINDEIGIRLGMLEEIIIEEDGYSADANAEILLNGMGIDSKYYDQELHKLPTNLQFSTMLCQALFGNPQALLLDEPTNHLDISSIQWLENFLKSYEGVLILISHDRFFLNSITTHIADIDYDTIIVYTGNYDDMISAKTQCRSQAESQNKSREKKIAQLRDFVAKFGAGTRASQVQSRLREIQRLQPEELKKSNIQRPYIRFIPEEKRPGSIVLRAKKIRKSYGDKNVIENFSIEVARGDKIGIIGKNGMGKTTLAKLLAQTTPADDGKISLGNNVSISFLPQNHQEAIDKTIKCSAFDWLKDKKPGIYDQDVRSVMGKLLFSGDDAFKDIENLSGGETARLLLAKMMIEDSNVLILDEPNNHLDLEAVSALAWGLEEYKETVIVVSHDRGLISSVAKKIIAFEDHGIEYFDGTLEEYLQKKSK